MIFKRSYELRIVAYYLKLTTNIIIYDNNPLWPIKLRRGQDFFFIVICISEHNPIKLNKRCKYQAKEAIL